MTVKSWVGIMFALIVFLVGGHVATRPGCTITPTMAAVFGGGLLFCGMLIDPEDFKALFTIWRSK